MDEAAGPRAGPMPLLALDGFAGTLDRLLDLARAGRVDLARLVLPDLLDQLDAGIAAAAPIAVRGDWLVTGAWLLLLRSRLLLPPQAPARLADGEADPLGDRPRFVDAGTALHAVQALADWLDRRPRLGRDVFAAGRGADRDFWGPDIPGSGSGGDTVDVVEFLWASQALFDEDIQAVRESSPRVRRPDLHSTADARVRILAMLARASAGPLSGEPLPRELPGGPFPLGRLLPEADAAASLPRARSRWTSTLVASLELAREGRLVLDQEAAFAPIHVGLPPGRAQP